MRRSVRRNPAKSFSEISSKMKSAIAEADKFEAESSVSESEFFDTATSESTDPLILKSMIDTKLNCKSTVMSNVSGLPIVDSEHLKYLKNAFSSVIESHFHNNYNIIVFFQKSHFRFAISDGDGGFHVFDFENRGFNESLNVDFLLIEYQNVKSMTSLMKEVDTKSMMTPVLINKSFDPTPSGLNEVYYMIRDVCSISQNISSNTSVDDNYRISIKVSSTLMDFHGVDITMDQKISDYIRSSTTDLNKINPKNTGELPPLSYDFIKSEIVEAAKVIKSLNEAAGKTESLTTINVLTTKDMLKFIYRNCSMLMPAIGMGLAPTDRNVMVPPDIDPFYKFKPGASIKSYEKFTEDKLGRNFFFNSAFFLSNDKIKEFAKLMVTDCLDSHNNTVTNNFVVLFKRSENIMYFIAKAKSPSFSEPPYKMIDFDTKDLVHGITQDVSTNEIGEIIDSLSGDDLMFSLCIDPSKTAHAILFALPFLVASIIHVTTYEDSVFNATMLKIATKCDDAIAALSEFIYKNFEFSSLENHFKKMVLSDPFEEDVSGITKFNDKYLYQQLNTEFVSKVITPYIVSCFDRGGLNTNSVMVNDAIEVLKNGVDNEFSPERLQSDLNAGYYDLIISLNFSETEHSHRNVILLYDKNNNNFLRITIKSFNESYNLDCGIRTVEDTSKYMKSYGNDIYLKTERRFFIFAKFEDGFHSKSDFKDTINYLIMGLNTIKVSSVAIKHMNGIDLVGDGKDPNSQCVRADLFVMALALTHINVDALVEMFHTTINIPKHEYLSNFDINSINSPEFVNSLNSIIGSPSSSIVFDSSFIDKAEAIVSFKNTTPVKEFESAEHEGMAIYSKLVVYDAIRKINKDVYVVDIFDNYSTGKTGFFNCLKSSISKRNSNFCVCVMTLDDKEVIGIKFIFSIGKDKPDSEDNELMLFHFIFDKIGKKFIDFGKLNESISNLDNIINPILDNDTSAAKYVYYGSTSNPMNVAMSVPLILMDKKLLSTSNTNDCLFTGFSVNPSQLGCLGDIKEYRNMVEPAMMKIVDFNDKINSPVKYELSIISNIHSYAFPLIKSFFSKYYRYELTSYRFSKTKFTSVVVDPYPSGGIFESEKKADYRVVNFISLFTRRDVYIYMYVKKGSEYGWIEIKFDSQTQKASTSILYSDISIKDYINSQDINDIYGYYSAFANGPKEMFLYLISVPLSLPKVFENLHKDKYGIQVVNVTKPIKNTYEISQMDTDILSISNKYMPINNESDADNFFNEIKKFYDGLPLGDKNYLTLDSESYMYKSVNVQMKDMSEKIGMSPLAFGDNDTHDIIEGVLNSSGISNKDEAVALIMSREVAVTSPSGAVLAAPVAARKRKAPPVPDMPPAAPVAPPMPSIDISTLSPDVAATSKKRVKQKTEVYLKSENLDTSSGEDNKWNALRINEIKDVISRTDEIINKYKQSSNVGSAAPVSAGTVFESLDFLISPPVEAGAISTASNDKYESVFIHILKQKKVPGKYDGGALPIAYKADNIAFDYSEFGITDDPRLSSLFNPVVIELIRDGKPLPIDKLNNVLTPNEHLYEGFKENPSNKARFANKERLVSIARKYLRKSNPTNKDIWKVQVFDAIGLPLDEAFKSKQYRKNPDTLTETQAQMIQLGIDSILHSFGLSKTDENIEKGFLSISSSNFVRSRMKEMMSTVYGSGGSIRAETGGIAQFFRYLVLARALGMWSNIIDTGERSVFRGLIPRDGHTPASLFDKLNLRNSSVRVNQDSKFALNALIQAGLINDNVTKLDAAKVWLKNQGRNFIFHRNDIATPFKISNNIDSIKKIIEKAKENKILNSIGGSELSYSMNDSNTNLHLSTSANKSELNVSARNTMQRPVGDSRFFGKLPYQKWSANIEANIEGFPVDLFDYSYNNFTFTEWSCVPFARISGYTYYGKKEHASTEFLGFRTNTRDPRFVSLPAPNYGYGVSLDNISMSADFTYENAVHFVNTNLGIGLPADIISIIDDVDADTFSTMEINLLKNWIAGRPAYPVNDPPDGKYINILLKK